MINRKFFRRTIILLLFSCSFAFSSLADGGIPILMLANGYAFIAGSLWVFLSEFFYLRKFLKDKVGSKKLAWWVILMNAITALAGTLLIPITLMFARLEPLIYGISRTPMPPYLWLVSFSVDFIVTYAITVLIEYALLRKFIGRFELWTKKDTFKQTVIFNLISYAGLIVILVATIMVLNAR